MAVQVAIYTRVSREDTEEPQSTRRQERACREFARMRNWDVADVWEDVDVSAYSRDVIRPAYNDLLRIVAGGRVNGVLVWKLDRLV
ncbi:MAG TPA: recombinase family protein, partial [Nitrospira sp.]|nr:recombinase family protein [Nitrospira sp.]